MTDREAMELALEALESAAKNECNFNDYKYAAKALRQSLEQPEQVKRVCNTCNGTGMVKGLHNWATGGKREQPCWNCHEVANKEKEPTLCDVGSEGCLYVQENNTMKAIENRLCDLERRMAKLETLEQPEQEPVAFVCRGKFSTIEHCEECEPLYAAPPKREWVGLTDEEEIELDEKYGDDFNAYIDARDAKLKENNS